MTPDYPNADLLASTEWLGAHLDDRRDPNRRLRRADRLPAAAHPGRHRHTEPSLPQGRWHGDRSPPDGAGEVRQAHVVARDRQRSHCGRLRQLRRAVCRAALVGARLLRAHRVQGAERRLPVVVPGGPACYTGPAARGPRRVPRRCRKAGDDLRPRRREIRDRRLRHGHLGRPLVRRSTRARTTAPTNATATSPEPFTWSGWK